MKLYRNMTKQEYLLHQLLKALRRSSKGRVSKERQRQLAERTISRLKLDNSFQMHKSLSAYADILVENELTKTAQ